MASTSEPPSDHDKWLADLELRRMDMALRERAQAARDREVDLQIGRERAERWRNPLTVALVAAAIAGMFNAVIAYQDNQAQLRLAQSRAESERILEVIKVNDPKRAAANLQFLLDLGLVEKGLLATQIKAYLADPDRPQAYLPAAQVRDFQMRAGLTPDGMAGPLTRAAMAREKAQEGAAGSPY